MFRYRNIIIGRRRLIFYVFRILKFKDILVSLAIMEPVELIHKETRDNEENEDNADNELSLIHI